MKIAVLGTGNVGTTLATALVGCGHDVIMGSRSAENPIALEWSGNHGAAAGTFSDAASASDIVVNATAGTATLDVLRSVGAAALAGKVVIDVANPLDFSNGFPPTLAMCNDDSLGEEIQREFPAARVVKALNTISCAVMVNPSSVPGDHVVFLAGNDDDAKSVAVGILGDLGWRPEQVLNLGDITAARATEMYLPLWLRLMQHVGHGDFNINLVVGQSQ